MSGKPWWQRLPNRFLEEDRLLQWLTGSSDGKPLVSSYRWFIEDEQMRIHVALSAFEVSTVEVRIPPNFPEGCPDVRPIPHKIISSHQFKSSGVLCLELGPDNWHPDHHIADLLLSTLRLDLGEVRHALEGVAVPTRHSDQSWHRPGAVSGHALVLIPDLAEQLSTLKTPTEMTCVRHLRSSSLQQFWPVELPKGEALKDKPAYVREGATLEIGGWILPTQDALPNSIADISKWLVAETNSVVEDAVFYLPNLPTPRAFHVKGESLDELFVLTIPAENARLGSIEQLARARVGIVGLGSLGSKIAVSLARSGVRTFVFADDELLLPENIVRHANSFEQVGLHKVHAVRDLVRAVCADALSFDIWPAAVSSAIPGELHTQLLAALSDCDVIIDATANPDAFTCLAAVASDSKQCFVAAEVWAGGLGGAIMSCHPTIDPCPRCVRAALLSALADMPPAPFRDSLARYATGDDAPVVASDAAVSFVASAAAEVTLRLIADGDAADNSPIVLLGLQREWIFSRPFETRSIRALTDDWRCKRCWKTADAPDKEALARVESLLEKANADDPREPDGD